MGFFNMFMAALQMPLHGIKIKTRRHIILLKEAHVKYRDRIHNENSEPKSNENPVSIADVIKRNRKIGLLRQQQRFLTNPTRYTEYFYKFSFPSDFNFIFE